MKKIFGIPIIGCDSTLCADTQVSRIHKDVDVGKNKTEMPDTPGKTTPS